MSEQAPVPKKLAKKSEALWLMSFSDMSLVMLCFFLLLISIMSPDKGKFEHMNEGMVVHEEGEVRPKTLKDIEEQMKEVIEENKLEMQASVSYDVKGLRIEFGDNLVFKTGSSKTNPKFSQTLEGVIKAISEIGPQYRIIVEGHTDDIPLKGGGALKSNWELSAARAIAVMRELEASGVSESKLGVAAYAHTRPLVKVKDLKGKELKKAREKNRRVVVWIE